MSPGLENRIMESQKLFFVYEDEKVIGIAAIKNPRDTYIKKIFSKSNTSHILNDGMKEIGWIFILEEYRRMNICKSLFKYILENTDQKNIFVTIRASNTAMQHVLESNNFIQVGNDYLSERGDYKLKIYIVK